MSRLRATLLLVLFATHGATAQEAGTLLGRVCGLLERSFYDESFRREQLPALCAEFERRARAAVTVREEARVVDELLARIPVSHLALYSDSTYASLSDELTGRARPTLGFQLVELEGAYHVDGLLEAGVAARAGVRRGDRVVAIDGTAPERSARLDRSSDDAALPDPPMHRLVCRAGEEVELTLESRPGARRSVRIVAAPDSGWDAMRRSARVVVDGPARIGYVHLWYVHMSGHARWLRELFAGRFADCDALVVDLRGRGGSASEARRITSLLASETQRGRPVIVLVDRATRSAKEVIAWDLQHADAALVVGEKTAGAVIPATFRDVGSGFVLMYPQSTLGRYTRRIEGTGVHPDVPAPYRLAYAAGRDEILRAGLIAARTWVASL